MTVGMHFLVANFSEKELQQIAEALGCKFEGFFVFEDGEKI